MASDDVVGVKSRLHALLKERDAVEAKVASISTRLNAHGQPGTRGPLVDAEGYPRADIDVHAARTDRHSLLCSTNDHKALTKQIDELLTQLHRLTRAPTGSAAPPSLSPVPVLPGEAAVSAPQDAAPGAAASAASGPGAAAPPSSAPSAMPAPTTLGAAAASAHGEGAGGGTSPAAAAPPFPAGRAGAAMSGQSVPEPVAVDTTVLEGVEQVAVSEALRPFALVDDVSEGSPASSAGVQVGDQLCRFDTVVASLAGDELQRTAQLLQALEGSPVATTVLRHGRMLTLSLTPQRWSGRGLLGCHLRHLR